MTKLMKMAVKALRSLPEDRQEVLARFLLNEIEEDARWEATTTRHGDRVDQLVTKVLEADDRGRTELLDPDQL